jgi:hypothetical protein
MREFRGVVGAKSRYNLFSRVACWQVLGFVMLLCLIWACELSGVLALYVNETATASGLVRAGVISAGVLVCAFVMIGNTYLQQRRIVSGFLTICSYCKNIQIDGTLWEQVEGYVSKHSRATFSHGICPGCYAKVEQEFGKQ